MRSLLFNKGLVEAPVICVRVIPRKTRFYREGFDFLAPASFVSINGKWKNGNGFRRIRGQCTLTLFSAAEPPGPVRDSHALYPVTAGQQGARPHGRAERQVPKYVPTVIALHL